MQDILIISPTLGKGGIERQLIEFLYAYDRNKFNITLALFRRKIEYELPADINPIILNKKGIIDVSFLFRLYKLLSKNWDVINSKISGVNEYILL